MESKISDRDQLIISILEENGFVIDEKESEYNICMKKETYTKTTKETKERKSGICIITYVRLPRIREQPEVLFTSGLYSFERDDNSHKYEQKFICHTTKIVDREITTENREIVINRTKRRINEGINEMKNLSEMMERFLSNKYIVCKIGFIELSLSFECVLCKKGIARINKDCRIFKLIDEELIEVENCEEINTVCSTC